MPATEADRLDALFRSTADRNLRDRLRIVLTARRGRARADRAADLGVHRKTVTRATRSVCFRVKERGTFTVKVTNASKNAVSYTLNM